MASSNRNLIIAGSMGLVVVVAASVVLYLAQNQQNTAVAPETAPETARVTSSQTSTQTQNPSSASSSSMASTTVTAASFKDGSYKAEGEYRSPAGNERIEVNLTLKNGLIEQVTVSPKADNATSLAYQNSFRNGISGEVKGKSLQDVSVAEINGSSLTGAGFNQAVESIKRQAQV